MKQKDESKSDSESKKDDYIPGLESLHAIKKVLSGSMDDSSNPNLVKKDDS